MILMMAIGPWAALRSYWKGLCLPKALGPVPAFFQVSEASHFLQLERLIYLNCWAEVDAHSMPAVWKDTGERQVEHGGVW